MYLEDKKELLGQGPFTPLNPAPAGIIDLPPAPVAEAKSSEPSDAKVGPAAAAQASTVMSHWADAKDPKSGSPATQAGDKPKSDQTQNPKATTPAVALAAVTDAPTAQMVDMLHPEEIFRDVGDNTVNKKQTFNKLDSAWEKQHKAEAALSAANAPKAKEAAQKSLETAKKETAAATQQLKNFLIGSLNQQLRHLNPQRDAAKIEQLQAELADLQTKPQAPAVKAGDDKKAAAEPEAKSDDVFKPQPTTVTHHDYAFPDGEHVRLRDHPRAYSTTAASGADSDSEQTSAEKAKGHTDVKNVMQNAGLGASKAKILGAISGFEGSFDTVNTYDRAQVTWGFMQWTGGSQSDLTAALTVIKQTYPESFAKNFQAYGIDVVRDQLVVKPADGSAPLSGDKAAETIMKDPRLAAVLSHAGRDSDIKKGQVKAAAHIEIDQALSLQLSDGEHHRIAASQLLSSEYGVALLANTAVHSGIGAAQGIAQRALQRYAAEHPYKPNDPKWAASAEAAILPALAAADKERAESLKKQLNNGQGTFKP